MTQIEEILKQTETLNAAQLFGKDPKSAYHRLVKLIHPDVVPINLKRRAEKAFARVTELYRGLNGKSESIAASAFLLGDWIVTAPLAKGDIADVYLAQPVKGGPPAVIKLARNPHDNDMMEAEAKALKCLHKNPVLAPYNQFLPQLLASFKASHRWANVLPYAQGYLSLAEIQSLYPKGLDFRHIVWMMNRLLSTLGFSHRRGVIHGAVLPEHLLYHPTNHGLYLIDWCFSSSHLNLAIIPAVVQAHKNLYPLEVLQKRHPLPSTDIYMAAVVLESAAQKVPKRFAPLFEWCKAQSPLSRPQDAWALQDRWKQLATEEYGPPKYVALSIPTN